MSTNAEDLEQKKKSQAIDRKLEEDSRRLRRECKILLLGMAFHLTICHGTQELTCFQVLAKVESLPS